jgi:3-methyladenine DNA glycosylase/8-oxoguanine DNA glycosylase
MKQVAHIRQISTKLRERLGDARKLKPYTLGGSAAPRAMPISAASPPNFKIEQGTARSTIKRVVYTFPSAERIAATSEKELRACALGYRAKNLLGTARAAASGEADLESWSDLSDVGLRSRLCELPGVGAKVANCVMLFAYERLRAFPIDVWIERVLREKYFPRARRLNAARLRAFTEGYFGNHGGYAQQYLFHHARKTGGRRAVGAKSGTRQSVSLQMTKGSP